MADAAAPQINGTEVMRALEFTGYPDGMAPSDFLRAIKQRRGVYGWDDAQTMRYIAGALSGAAGGWFG